MPTYSDSFAGSGPLVETEVGKIPWQVITGTWQRNNGRAYSADAASANPMAVIDIGNGDADINLGVSYQGGDAIYFRVASASNWQRLKVNRYQQTSSYSYYNTEYEYSQTTYRTEYQYVTTYFSQGGTTYHWTESYSSWTTSSSMPSASPFTHNHDGYGSHTMSPYVEQWDTRQIATGTSYTWSTSHPGGTWQATGASRQVGPYTGYSTNTYYQVQLEKCVNGTISTTQSWTTNSSLSTIRVIAKGPTISVYLNSVQQAGISDSVHQSNTKHGIGKGASPLTGTGIDNFSLTTFQPATPTGMHPVNNAAVNTATPTLLLNLSAYGISLSKAEWQLATNSSFTTNLRTITQADSQYRTSGYATHLLTEAQKLTQTTWYIRGRQIAQSGEISEWTATHSFVVSHIPGAINLKPSNGNGVIFGATNRHTWEFADTSATDSQTAFRVAIERNDNAEVLIDTGKTLSSNQYYDAALSATYKNVVLRWRVQVWDEEDKVSSWTPYQLFTPSDPPILNITEPLQDSTVLSSRPDISWTFSATGGRVQASHRIVFTKQGAAVPEFDSGTLIGADNAYRPPIPVVQDGFVYDLDVYVTDSINITVVDRVTFDATYEAPEAVIFTIDAAAYEEQGYVFLTWQSVYDPTFLYWKIYRRVLGDVDWIVLGTVEQQEVTQFKDWQAPAMDDYEYMVVQVVERFGAEVESYLAQPVQAFIGTGGYWLIDPNDSSNNVRLHNVTEESYSNATERAELLVIGRGRHVDQGETIGVTGSLTAQLRNTGGTSARAKKRSLESLQKRKIPVYLRNPFGDVVLTSLGDMEISRVAGVGTDEFVDISLPYLEIF